MSDEGRCFQQISIWLRQERRVDDARRPIVQLYITKSTRENTLDYDLKKKALSPKKT